jgi:hypothetical protein
VLSDERLADCFVTLSDTLTALQVTDGLLRRDGGAGFMAGIPPFVYALQRALASEADDLGRLKPADPTREAVRLSLLERVAAASESLGLLAQAIRAAQVEGGWYGQPRDLMAQSVSRLPDFTGPYPAAVKELWRSAPFRAALPGAGVPGLPEDTTGFLLGALVWVRSPLDLAAVIKGLTADKVGLRAGDTLLSVGGQEPKSLLDLKAAIKKNVGGRLRLAVLRGGRRKEWEAGVPRDLPQRKD